MSESLIQGLHEECKAAKALAAKWEEIALALATYEMLLEKQGNQYRTFTVKAGDKFGEWYDTPQAALLVWADQQEEATK